MTQSPTEPTGHLVSMKLRALTPDGIRIAIAKEYGLSNYREVHFQLAVCSVLLWHKSVWDCPRILPHIEPSRKLCRLSNLAQHLIPLPTKSSVI